MIAGFSYSVNKILKSTSIRRRSGLVGPKWEFATLCYAKDGALGQLAGLEKFIPSSWSHPDTLTRVTNHSEPAKRATMHTTVHYYLC